MGMSGSDFSLGAAIFYMYAIYSSFSVSF